MILSCLIPVLHSTTFKWIKSHSVTAGITKTTYDISFTIHSLFWGLQILPLSSAYENLNRQGVYEAKVNLEEDSKSCHWLLETWGGWETLSSVGEKKAKRYFHIYSWFLNDNSLSHPTTITGALHKGEEKMVTWRGKQSGTREGRLSPAMKRERSHHGL